MKTLLNQEIKINNQTFYTSSCRFEDVCPKYNPALTVPVTLTVGGVRVGATEKLCVCTHGGGLGCFAWKRMSTRASRMSAPKPQLEWHSKLEGIQAVDRAIIEAPTLDKSERTIDKLKNLKLEI